MSKVVLGNVAVREVIGHDEENDNRPVFQTYTGQAATEIHLPDSWSEDEKFRQVTHENGFWPVMSSEKPAWVESDDEALASALSYFYGCPVGRPAEWEDSITRD